MTKDACWLLFTAVIQSFSLNQVSMF
jgi:hypothetical protein